MLLTKWITCPECDGRGYIPRSTDNSAWSDQCVKCNGTGLIQVPVTNGDILRELSNEKLDLVFTHLEMFGIIGYHKPPSLTDPPPQSDFLKWLNKNTDETDIENIFKFAFVDLAQYNLVEDNK